MEKRIIDGAIKAEFIINTIPWTLWPRLTQLPETIQNAVASLVHTGVHVDYHPENVASPAHWIYEPREAKGITPLAAPQFLRRRARPLDRNQRKEISRSGRASLRQRVRLSVSTVGKPAAIGAIVDWFRGRGIIGIGRWGTWEHINSDVAVELALKRRRNALAREMKITLCLLVFNERAGCEVDVPKLRRDTFDDVYAVDGGSTDGTVEYLESQGIPVFKQSKPSLNAAYAHAVEICKTEGLVVFFPKGTLDPDCTKGWRTNSSRATISSSPVASSMGTQRGGSSHPQAEEVGHQCPEHHNVTRLATRRLPDSRRSSRVKGFTYRPIEA